MARVGFVAVLTSFIATLLPLASAGPLDLPPSPPTDLEVFGSGFGMVLMSWDRPLYNGTDAVQGYRIYFNGLLLADLPATTLSYVYFGLAAGTFGVAAYNGIGESPASLSSFDVDFLNLPPVVGGHMQVLLARGYPWCDVIREMYPFLQFHCLFPLPIGWTIP